MSTDESTRIGVVGVGNMGQNHARVYAGLPNVELVGVADVDPERAREVAARHDTRAMEQATLLANVDGVSLAVPTTHHAALVHECIEAGVAVLVEKPFVADPDDGRQLCNLAEERGVILQVGHVERFNPAVRVVADILADEEVIAVDACRLGAPRERDIRDSVVMDLMIHDIDVVCSLVDNDIERINAVSAEGSRYVDAQIRFECGVVGSLTASRVTQRKIREFAVTTRECWIVVDYIRRSVEIHRQSPRQDDLNDDEYTAFDSRGWRHGIDSNEGIIEQPLVGDGEPLKKELASFMECVRTGDDPVVTGEDGLRALRVAKQIDRLAAWESVEVDTK